MEVVQGAGASAEGLHVLNLPTPFPLPSREQTFSYELVIQTKARDLLRKFSAPGSLLRNILTYVFSRVRSESRICQIHRTLYDHNKKKCGS